MISFLWLRPLRYYDFICPFTPIGGIVFSIMPKINLKDALDIIHRGEWFSIRYITADVIKGTGGKVIDSPKARLARAKTATAAAAQRTSDAAYARKDHRHHDHFTLNIEYPNKQIRKVHPILITHINNSPVL